MYVYALIRYAIPVNVLIQTRLHGIVSAEVDVKTEVWLALKLCVIPCKWFYGITEVELNAAPTFNLSCSPLQGPFFR